MRQPTFRGVFIDDQACQYVKALCGADGVVYNGKIVSAVANALLLFYDHNIGCCGDFPGQSDPPNVGRCGASPGQSAHCVSPGQAALPNVCYCDVLQASLPFQVVYSQGNL